MLKNKQKILFTILFILVGFGLMQVPFTKLVGANVKFSLFDFYGPIVGSFLGSAFGLTAVLLMQLANWALHGFALDAGTIIRFFPMLFAVLYFARKSKWILLVPTFCLLAFWAHPEGRAAWYFALYWLIPIAMYFWRDRFVFARALGTTFTAHAVGGALWIWIFNMKASAWIGLIPIVWKERGLMAIGITLTYLLFNKLFQVSVNRGWLKLSALKLHQIN